jgi:hypothetical protein
MFVWTPPLLPKGVYVSLGTQAIRRLHRARQQEYGWMRALHTHRAGVENAMTAYRDTVRCASSAIVSIGTRWVYGH